MKVSLLGHLFEQDRKFSSEERESDRRHHKERRRGFRGKEEECQRTMAAMAAVCSDVGRKRLMMAARCCLPHHSQNSVL